ncbi:MAG: transcriptional repressor LexA [Patescibacteria group bacterium]
MVNLTPKQKQILDFIKGFIEENGYPPSLAEMAKQFKKSIPTVHQLVETLKHKGFLTKETDVARGIYMQEPEIFLLGRIAAGKPIEPLENPDPIKVPKEMIDSPGNYYALEVKGDSMIDEGILDKDIIVVRHQNTAENGNIVVAVTEKGATLKTFRQKDGKIYLEPKNKRFKNIYPKNLKIRGRYIGLIRKNV